MTLTWPFTPNPAEKERDDPLAAHNFLKYDQSQAPPPRLWAWRQLIPTCIQRLGLAEWPKWQQSSWPWRCRSVEWFLLCPCGHRGLVEMGCFLRGHLAALCSYPSNTGIGISTWFGGGSVTESRKPLYKVMMDHDDGCRWHVTCMHASHAHTLDELVWVGDQSCAAEPSNPYKKNEV